MTNEPGTYHVLVTLPDVTGEQSDIIVGQLENYVVATYADPHGDELPTVEHLTPETLPARYMERPSTFWTLTHIADWEGGTTIYTSRDELVEQVKSDAADAAQYAAGYGVAGVDELVDVHDDALDTDDLDKLASYVHENGWKVHHYMIEQHTVPAPAVREDVPV